jgi:hypothetical protein
MKPKKEVVSITLDADVVKKIKDYAENDDRSFSSYIDLLLKKHIEVTENKTTSDK